MAGISYSLSAFFPGLSCQEGQDGWLLVFAEGRLVSNLPVAELLGSPPDPSNVEIVLDHVIGTVQDDLLGDWGRWQTPALAAQVDAIKLAYRTIWQEGAVWRWGYRLPDGELLELEPLPI